MEKLFNELGIKPNNIKLYTAAFSHSSYAHEHNVKSDYERLEFLGDAVLELVISEYLYKNMEVKAEGKEDDYITDSDMVLTSDVIVE